MAFKINTVVAKISQGCHDKRTRCSVRNLCTNPQKLLLYLHLLCYEANIHVKGVFSQALNVAKKKKKKKRT